MKKSRIIAQPKEPIIDRGTLLVQLGRHVSSYDVPSLNFKAIKSRFADAKSKRILALHARGLRDAKGAAEAREHINALLNHPSERKAVQAVMAHGLHHENEEIAHASLKALHKFADKGVYPFVPEGLETNIFSTHLKSSNPKLRLDTLKYLAKVSRSIFAHDLKVPTKEIINHIKSDDLDTRINALEIIGHRGDYEDIGVIEQYGLKHSDPRVKEAAELAVRDIADHLLGMAIGLKERYEEFSPSEEETLKKSHELREKLKAYGSKY
jgi:hypothetical protein